MYFSLSTTHRPATDLGFLLMKHPERVHEVELGFGRAIAFYPDARPERCEAALVLDVDPVGLVRGRDARGGLMDQYVNDRPYAASSFLSVALNRIYRSAMAGNSRERPELAATAIPLELIVTPLPVRGAENIVERLFEPLGWTVTVARVDEGRGPSRYVTLRLNGVNRVADALGHIYVLVPVLDEQKHYWVGDDEVEKLLAKGSAWLSTHRERELITRRYLKGRRDLVSDALARLAPEENSDAPIRQAGLGREEALEAQLRLHDQRLGAVAAILAESGAAVVADLGCGEGKLIERLIRDKRFEKIIGLDASARSLERASERLKLGRPGGPKEGRVILLHGALTYRDERWRGADAAALVEVIEHLDPDRLPVLADVVFGAAHPKTVVVTTPNADYNALFPALPSGAMRHPDHRFEWTRAEFRAWASEVEARYGYKAAYSGIGQDHPEFGPVSQMAVFSR